jgi:hypothetical protein
MLNLKKHSLKFWTENQTMKLKKLKISARISLFGRLQAGFKISAKTAQIFPHMRGRIKPILKIGS